MELHGDLKNDVKKVLLHQGTPLPRHSIVPISPSAISSMPFPKVWFDGGCKAKLKGCIGPSRFLLPVIP